jgi:cell wall-associated NlpC family hydrolase
MTDPTFILYAMSFVGTQYRWGGDDPIEGFDCSGFVIELLTSQGLLPYGFDTTAQGLYTHFSQADRGSIVLKPSFGALAFYGKSIKQINHIAFCLDNFRMLEAGGGDSTVRDRTTAAQKNAFIRMRPIQFRKDFVGAVMPHYLHKTNSG